MTWTAPMLRRALPAGRFLKSFLVADGDPLAAHAYCEAHFAWSEDVRRATKSAVDALGTANAGSLATVRHLMSDFFALVRARTVLGRLEGLRRVPENTSMLRVTSGPTAHWLGENSPIKMGRMSLERDQVEFSKIACAVVVTNEIVMRAGEVAELALTREIAAAVSAFEDQAFLDPTRGAVASVSPASISWGLTAVESTGSTAAQIAADFKLLFRTFEAADGALDRAVLIMHPRSALHLAQLMGANGGLAYPRVGVRGGEVAGIPVLVSSACDLSGSPGEAFAVLLDPEQIMHAYDDTVEIESTGQASVELSDTPATGATSLVSLWQNGLRAMKLVRPTTWKRTSNSGVAVMRSMTW